MLGKKHLVPALKTKRFLNQRLFHIGDTNRIALTPDFCGDCLGRAYFFYRPFGSHLHHVPLNFSVGKISIRLQIEYHLRIDILRNLAEWSYFPRTPLGSVVHAATYMSVIALKTVSGSYPGAAVGTA